MESIRELRGTLLPTLQPAGLALKGYLPGQVIRRSVCLGQGNREGVIPLLGRGTSGPSCRKQILYEQGPFKNEKNDC